MWLLQTTEEKQRNGGFVRADGAVGASLVLLCIITLALLLNSDLRWQENAHMYFSLGYFLVSGILTLPKPPWT